MTRVAVIGSGFVGRAWAISFARAGCEVALWDQDKDAPGKAQAYIERLLPDLEANDLLNGGAANEVATRIRVAATLETALEGAAHVQENTPEDVEVKRAVFARLDAAAPPDAVLASSTSAILPSAFTENLKGRARCLVVHPINPPYLIPAAEVVPAPWTDPSVVERAAEFLRAAGHAPIVMKREIDGFVMNRLQGALLGGGLSARRAGIRRGRGRRCRDSRRAGVALVLHGAVRDHRPQRARRGARLRRPLSRHLFRHLPIHAMARRLERASHGQSRVRARASAWLRTNLENARLGGIAA